MKTRTPVLLAVACAAVLLLAGCDGGAFESNDYFMTFLTSQPTGKQLANSSGRADDTVATAIVRAGSAAYLKRRADERYDEAMDLYGSGEYDLAAQVMDEAIARQPDDIRFREARAKIALFEGDTDNALAQWEEYDRIAAANGFDQTKQYWNQARGRAATLLIELRDGPSTPETDLQLAAVNYRYADTIDGTADFMEATGGDPGMIQTFRDEAVAVRQKAAALETP